MLTGAITFLSRLEIWTEVISENVGGAQGKLESQISEVLFLRIALHSNVLKKGQIYTKFNLKNAKITLMIRI